MLRIKPSTEYSVLAAVRTMEKRSVEWIELTFTLKRRERGNVSFWGPGLVGGWK